MKLFGIALLLAVVIVTAQTPTPVAMNATHVTTIKVDRLREYPTAGGYARDERITTTHTFASHDSRIIVSTNIVATNTTALVQPALMR